MSTTVEKHSWAQINIWAEIDRDLKVLKDTMAVRSISAVIEILIEEYKNNAPEKER